MYGAAFLVFIIVRIIMAARSGENEASTNTRPIFFTLLRVAVGAALLTMTVNERRLGVGAMTMLVLLPGVPVALVAWLGIPVLPYWLTRGLRPWSASKENRGAAVFWELRARVRHGWLLGPAQLKKLADSILLATDAPTARSYTIAAQAMVDALRGDHEQARLLFKLALELRHNSYVVRSYCHAWLLADAAERGNWVQVLRLARLGPFSVRKLLFRSCAEQLLGLRSHSRLRLRLLWLLAPGRRHTLALVRACERFTREEPPALGRDWRAAFEGAARLVVAAPGGVTLGEIERVAALWQRHLDSGALRAQLLSRMPEQGSGFDVELSLAKLEQQVIATLANTLSAAVPGDEGLSANPPLLLLAAHDRLQDELFGELESLCAGLETGDTGWNADLEQLVRRWAEIRSTAQRAAELFPASRELFYDNFGTSLLNHAAWMHNQASAYPLSCDVFRWLGAWAPSDHEDQTLLRNNEKLSHTAAQNQ